jgi:hypothetical protein
MRGLQHRWTSEEHQSSECDGQKAFENQCAKLWSTGQSAACMRHTHSRTALTQLQQKSTLSPDND